MTNRSTCNSIFLKFFFIMFSLISFMFMGQFQRPRETHLTARRTIKRWRSSATKLDDFKRGKKCSKIKIYTKRAKHFHRFFFFFFLNVVFRTVLSSSTNILIHGGESDTTVQLEQTQTFGGTNGRKKKSHINVTYTIFFFLKLPRNVQQHPCHRRHNGVPALL